MNNLKMSRDAFARELEKSFEPIPEDIKNAMIHTTQNLKEAIIMKRKISFALALALIIIMIAGIAFALNSWFDIGKTIINRQQESGEFIDWPMSDKIALIKEIEAQGLIKKTQDIDSLQNGTLSANVAHDVANRALIEFTGRDLIDISFAEIMEGAWGTMDRWTYEQNAWYSKTIYEAGVEKEGHTFYIVPNNNTINETMAINIAKNAIIEGFNYCGYVLSRETLNEYEVYLTFELPEDRPIGEELPYWRVELTATSNISNDVMLFNIFHIYVNSETGELRESVVDIIARLPKIPAIY